jgi:hypothetical protein
MLNRDTSINLYTLCSAVQISVLIKRLQTTCRAKVVGSTTTSAQFPSRSLFGTFFGFWCRVLRRSESRPQLEETENKHQASPHSVCYRELLLSDHTHQPSITLTLLARACMTDLHYLACSCHPSSNLHKPGEHCRRDPRQGAQESLHDE